MGKFLSDRNYGWGKQLGYAGFRALVDKYGRKYATIDAHKVRFGQFAKWAKSKKIKCARKISNEVVRQYAAELRGKVRKGEMSVAYAQNLLSSVNVALECMRNDRKVWCRPSELVGRRSYVRSTPPLADRRPLLQAMGILQQRGHTRAAATLLLCREAGLRVREASMLNLREASRQLGACGKINVTEGTKGGRGRRVDRWVPASERLKEALSQAREAAAGSRNLIPREATWKEFNSHLHAVWDNARKGIEIGNPHQLRAGWACERYMALTGHAAPVVAGVREAPKDLDREAREILAQELGHNRTDVLVAYIGSAS